MAFELPENTSNESENPLEILVRRNQVRWGGSWQGVELGKRIGSPGGSFRININTIGIIAKTLRGTEDVQQGRVAPGGVLEGVRTPLGLRGIILGVGIEGVEKIENILIVRALLRGGPATATRSSLNPYKGNTTATDLLRFDPES